MAEYNFWDDRTTEENDDYWCPIKMCYCISDDCENCEKYKEFEDYVNRHFEEKKNKPNNNNLRYSKLYKTHLLLFLWMVLPISQF